MSESRSSISQAQSYREIGEFWDTHDLTDYWAQTEEVEFEVDLQSEARYLALERTLATQVEEIAWQRGVSVETLVNLWVKEKLEENMAPLTSAA
jgi:predicted DNA-binding ribbon-helix-helix protein